MCEAYWFNLWLEPLAMAFAAVVLLMYLWLSDKN